MLESTWKSHMRRGFAAGVAALTWALVTVAAEPASAQGNAPVSDPRVDQRVAQRIDRSAPPRPSDEPLPSCLDQDLKDQLRETLQPRGVQKRPFLKNKKLVVSARGGLFAADLLSSSYLAGGALGVFLTEDFGIEASFAVTPVALDLDRPLAEFFGDERFESSTGYLGLLSLMWSPIQAKLRMGGGIVRSDILFTVGAGRLFHDSVQGVTFDAGMAIDLFLTRWLTVRFDLRDVIAVQEAVAETRLTNNIQATMGIALWIPTGL
ncbi:MAG: outer membrane beta-barrel domain-containing protein [Myxococcota bacterium]